MIAHAADGVSLVNLAPMGNRDRVPQEPFVLHLFGVARAPLDGEVAKDLDSVDPFHVRHMVLRLREDDRS
jgi:hypothetical protein